MPVRKIIFLPETVSDMNSFIWRTHVKTQAVSRRLFCPLMTLPVELFIVAHLFAAKYHNDNTEMLVVDMILNVNSFWNMKNRQLPKLFLYIRDFSKSRIRKCTKLNLCVTSEKLVELADRVSFPC